MDEREQFSAQARALLKQVEGSAAGFDLAHRLSLLKRALDLFRRAGDRLGEARTLDRLGNTADNLADYVAAIDYITEAKAIAQSLGDAELERVTSERLVGSYLSMGDFGPALELAQARYEHDRDSADPKVRLFATNLLGCALVEMGRAEEGLQHLLEADGLSHLIEPESLQLHVRSQSRADIAQALLALGRAGEAFEAAREGEAMARQMGHEPLAAHNGQFVGCAALRMGEAKLAMDTLQAVRDVAVRLSQHALHRQVLFHLSSAFAALGRHAEAYQAHVDAYALEKSTGREEAFRRAEFLRARDEIERARFEKKAADRLLFSVLPAPIARRMQGGEVNIADDLPEASVLFADLVGFTALSTRLEPRMLLAMLERIFSEFDALAASLQLEKIKTIGDAYLVVGGALEKAPEPLERCARMAFGMMEAVSLVARDMQLPLSLRAGLHMGPAIAGVLGRERLAYDIWGETVNLASRLESSGRPGRLHMLASVAARLGGSYSLEHCGPVQLKGIGEASTVLLRAR
jgi:class 3 adenylate cyclase